MRKHIGLVALTLSSMLTIFLALTYLGWLDELFAEHGGDRAACIFIYGGPLALCCCYLFWRRFGNRITYPVKLLVMTPLVGISVGVTVGPTLWPFFIGAWFAFLGYEVLKQWRRHGQWRALFVHADIPHASQ